MLYRPLTTAARKRTPPQTLALSGMAAQPSYAHRPAEFKPLSLSSHLFKTKTDIEVAISAYSEYTGFFLSDVRQKNGFIVDMDGVLYHQNKLVPGADLFVQWLQDNEKKFLFLTNSSERSPRELAEKLKRFGIHVGEEHFYTSALATASFLMKSVRPGKESSAFVIGEPGLTSALYDAGISMNDTDPDFVVVGETRNYNYEKLEHAVHLVRAGARLIGTNHDVRDRKGSSFVPACGALIKPIELAAGATAYFVGKPNPMMMRAAMERLGVDEKETIIIGDRMDTDILAGVQSEIHTVLCLSGVTAFSDLPAFAFRPHCVVKTVEDIVPSLIDDSISGLAESKARISSVVDSFLGSKKYNS